MLIVDDDPHIRDVVRIATQAAGFATIEAANGQTAVAHIGREAIDLVVLDVGMPQMDGFECCKQIRAKFNAPVLFLTAHDDEVDRVLGFQLGAYDFVAKPFSPRELVLRLKAILARGKPTLEAPLCFGSLEMDRIGHTCRIGSDELIVTATEFSVLSCLLAHPEQVHDRNQLIAQIYGPNTSLSGRTIDSHVRNIRHKAARLGCADLIVTVHGIGVKLGACNR